MNDQCMDSDHLSEVTGYGRRTLLLLFITVAVVIMALGYWLYDHERTVILQDKYTELSTISALKVREIVQWRIERLADADRLRKSAILEKAFANFIKDVSNSDHRAGLRQHLELEQVGDVYNEVQLLAPEGNPLLTSTDYPDAIGEATLQAMATAFASRQSVISELYIPDDGAVQLDAVGPIWDTNGQPLAVIVLSVHAENFLYPLIKSWPTPSLSAETLLVRQTGESVLFLNELRHGPGAALSLRIPLTQTDVPAVQAVLGRRGDFVGLDYRGVETLSDLRAIPKSSWLMVAKIDMGEVMADAHKKARSITLMVVLTILFTGAMFGFAYRRQQQTWLYQKLYHAERKNKAAEAATAQLQHQTDLILNAAGEGIYGVDLAGNVTFINQEAANLLGYEKTELLNRSAHDVIHHTRSDQTPYSWEESPVYLTLTGGLPKAGSDEVFWRQDGSNFLVEYTATPIVDDHHQVMGAVVVFRDISLRKQTERELCQHREHLEELVSCRTAELGKLSKAIEQSPVSVVICSRDGIIEYVNPKFTDISGFTKAEALGQNPRILKSGQHPQEFYQDMWQTLSAGHLWQGELLNKHKDGKFFWERAMMAPIHDDAGTITHYVAVKEDVTARKQADDELKMAKLAAEAANQAKSTFVANMSHEIRTPMNAIIGLSYLCLQTKLTAQQSDYIRKIHSSAGSLLHIINDILDFSKIEAGRMEIESIDFVLEDVFGTLSTMVALKAKEKGIELILHTAVDTPPHLVGDPLRLGQVLINLTNNAIKFTEKGEVMVAAKVLATHALGITLQFAVRDSGMGMTAEQIEKLFQAFSQADASVTRKFGGTGLGLAISQRLVEGMGGKIVVGSEPGVGSTFTFAVSCGVADDTPKRSYAVNPDLHGLKVLVVDRNSQARHVTVDYLQAFTFSVSQASTGHEALNLAQEAEQAGDPFKLVVMSYWLPEIDGMTTTLMLHSGRIVRQPPPVIMVMTYGDDALVKRVMTKAHVQGFLVKPITGPSALFATVMAALGQDQPAQQGSTTMATLGRNSQNTLAGARILVVEDNEINQQVAKELLEQAQVTVVLAGNGQQAVDWVQKADFDGVLMDMQMPIMDGMSATREIRKDPTKMHLPILAMTANAMVGDREKCLAAGMQDYITKPVNPAEMFATLSRWIKPAQPKPFHPETLTGDVPNGDDASKSLPEIPGLDTARGLSYLGGNVRAYLALLSKFRRNQTGVGYDLQKALAEGDLVTAERLIHTVKGVLATVGATDLAEEARVLELAIKNGTDGQKVQLLLASMTEKLTKLGQDLDQALPEKVAPVRVEPVSVETDGMIAQRNQLLRKVAVELKTFDGDVERTLAAIKNSPIANDMFAWMQKIEHHVAQYDFEGALGVLQQGAYDHKIDLGINGNREVPCL